MQEVALATWVAFSNRYRELRERGGERGLTTTEIAVLTFVLVATAVAIGALLYNYAQGRVDALPEDTSPVIPSDG